MKYFNNFDKAYLLLVFPILRMNWSVLQYRVRAATVIPFVLLWFFCVWGRREQKVIPVNVLNKYFWCTVIAISLYILLPLFYGMTDPGDRLSFRGIGSLARFVEFFLMFSVVHISLTTGRIRELKFCTCILFLTAIWNGVAALRGGAQVAQMGGGARVVTALGQQSTKSTEYYQNVEDVLSLGMGTAESSYVSAFLISLFLFSVFNVRGWLKKSILIILVICSYLNIKYAGLNTPIMIAIAGCGLVCLTKFKSRFLILFSGILLAIYMIVFSFNPKVMSFMAGPLRAVAESTEDFPQFQVRCRSLADAVEGSQSTYAAVRYELQQASAMEFIKGDILFGRLFSIKRRGGGGHSELLDCLAAFGLLGGFVIMLFWYAYLRYCNQLAKVSLGRNWVFMPYIYAGAWIFSSIVNPAVLGSPAVLLAIPGIAVFYNDFEKRWSIV